MQSSPDVAQGAGGTSNDDVMATLSAVNVSFTLEGPDGTEVRNALSQVSLDVRRGELLVLVGKSGCGKTTVLNVLAGLVEPSAGSARVASGSPAEARSHVAYMFARDALLPWRRAIRNVEFALELRRPDIDRAERRKIAQRFLDELGVGRSSKLYPWQLSQGMRQRVALARTWAIQPDLLLMDEPFAALDTQTRASTQRMFLEAWAAHHGTVVFVTHDLGEAILLADRIVVMAEGAVVDEMTIEMPRPRDPDLLVEDPRYADLHKRLVAALHDVQPSLAGSAS